MDQPLKEKKILNVAIAIEKEKCKINLNKVIYIGTRIFDLNKALMQDFHYNYIKNKFGDKADMLLTDTDCLMYKVVAENIYVIIKSYLTSVIIQKI